MVTVAMGGPLGFGLSDVQLQEEMLLALRTNALPLAAAACAEVCSRHLASLRAELSRAQQLHAITRTEVGHELDRTSSKDLLRPPGGRSTRSASPLQRALDFTKSADPLEWAVDMPTEGKSVMQRVRKALMRSGHQCEQVFERLCRSGGGDPLSPLMVWADFARLISTFDRDLEPNVVLRLWQALVPNGSMGIDLPTFKTWFCPVDPHASASVSRSSSASLGTEQSAFSRLLDSSSSFSMDPYGGVSGPPQAFGMPPSAGVTMCGSVKDFGSTMLPNDYTDWQASYASKPRPQQDWRCGSQPHLLSPSLHDSANALAAETELFRRLQEERRQEEADAQQKRRQLQEDELRAEMQQRQLQEETHRMEIETQRMEIERRMLEDQRKQLEAERLRRDEDARRIALAAVGVPVVQAPAVIPPTLPVAVAVSAQSAAQGQSVVTSSTAVVRPPAAIPLLSSSPPVPARPPLTTSALAPPTPAQLPSPGQPGSTVATPPRPALTQPMATASPRLAVSGTQPSQPPVSAGPSSPSKPPLPGQPLGSGCATLPRPPLVATQLPVPVQAPGASTLGPPPTPARVVGCVSSPAPPPPAPTPTPANVLPREPVLPTAPAPPRPASASPPAPAPPSAPLAPSGPPAQVPGYSSPAPPIIQAASPPSVAPKPLGPPPFAPSAAPAPQTRMPPAGGGTRATPQSGQTAPLSGAGFAGAVATGKPSDAETFVGRLVYSMGFKIKTYATCKQLATEWSRQVMQENCIVERSEAIYEAILQKIRQDAQTPDEWVYGGPTTGIGTGPPLAATPPRPAPAPAAKVAMPPPGPLGPPPGAPAPLAPASTPPAPSGGLSALLPPALCGPPPGPAGPPPAPFSGAPPPAPLSASPPGTPDAPPGPMGAPPGPKPPGPGGAPVSAVDRGDAAARRRAEFEANTAARQREAAERRERAKAKAAAMKAAGGLDAMMPT